MQWTREQLTFFLREQLQAFRQLDPGVEREQLAILQQAASLPSAVMISSLRQVGKSTLLAQMAKRLGDESYYYLNFEDERFLGFQTSDMNMLYQVLVETFGERSIFAVGDLHVLGGLLEIALQHDNAGVAYQHLA